MSGRMHGTTGAVFAGHMVTFSVPCVIGDLASPGASPKIPFVKLTRHSALALLDKPSAAPHPRAMADAPSETRVELIVVGGGLVGSPPPSPAPKRGLGSPSSIARVPRRWSPRPSTAAPPPTAKGFSTRLRGTGAQPASAAC